MEPASNYWTRVTWKSHPLDASYVEDTISLRCGSSSSHVYETKYVYISRMRCTRFLQTRATAVHRQENVGISYYLFQFFLLISCYECYFCVFFLMFCIIFFYFECIRIILHYYISLILLCSFVSFFSILVRLLLFFFYVGY